MVYHLQYTSDLYIFHNVCQGCVLDSFDGAIDWILDRRSPTVHHTVPGVYVSPDCFTELDYADGGSPCRIT